MTARTFRAVVFDLDGTLLDSYDGIHEALNATRLAFGFSPVTLDETRRMVGRGVQVLIARALPGADVEEGVRFFRGLYHATGPAGTRLMPGAEEVTAELFRRGAVLIAASNKPSDFSRQLLEALGIGERFSVVAGPDQGFPPKPDPAMVSDALQKTGIEPEDALFVGDMPIDVQTAKALGMRVAVLPTGSSTLEELQTENPDFVLRNLAEVLPLFGREVVS